MTSLERVAVPGTHLACAPKSIGYLSLPLTPVIVQPYVPKGQKVAVNGASWQPMVRASRKRNPHGGLLLSLKNGEIYAMAGGF